MTNLWHIKPTVELPSCPLCSQWLLGASVAFLLAACSVVPLPTAVSTTTASPLASDPDSVPDEMEVLLTDVTPEVAHNFMLTTLDGGTLSLYELRGRWVIVNFWATWCGPCRNELPYLQQLAETHAAHVVVLGINMREEAATIRPFLADIGVTFPILLNPDDATLLWYNTRGLPLTFVIAPDGTVAYYQYGELRPEEFDRWLTLHLNAVTGSSK